MATREEKRGSKLQYLLIWEGETEIISRVPLRPGSYIYFRLKLSHRVTRFFSPPQIIILRMLIALITLKKPSPATTDPSRPTRNLSGEISRRYLKRAQ